ncbi:MAG TPA: sortase [Candidatus Saccharimonadales bacterium]|nr:sortase [Candidatus Saccharimonadales bacterium]
MQNPLFPQSDTPQDDGFLLPAKVSPLQPADTPEANPAADVIRQKLAKIYAQEPDAAAEIEEAEAAHPMSPHQRFMHELSSSGKNLAQIQTEWHNYYVALPDDEKRQVWQEFYESNTHNQATVAAPHTATVAGQPGPAPIPEPTEQLASHRNEIASSTNRNKTRHTKSRDSRSPGEIRSAIRNTVSAGGKLKAKHHLQSLAFGLGLGSIVIFIFLFGFFNEAFIAPFIQPSRTAVAAPIILSSDAVAPTTTPEVIIPKINVEIPVDYSQTSTNETDIENALQSGIVHYPTTQMPGEVGNAAFFGHSSNNIFAPGKYKFAFALLHELVPGDTFYLTNNGKVYAYKVFSRTIVDPTDVGVLNPVAGHKTTATLITCDPPGTSWRRLVVVGDQISPDPTTNTAAAQPTTTPTATTILPGNGQTMWSRWWGSIVGKIVTIMLLLGAGYYLVRRVMPKPRAVRSTM